MSAPALLPAVALAAGALAGIALEPRAWALLALLGACALAGAALAHRREAPRTVCTHLALGFFAAGAMLGSAADHRAAHTPLSGLMRAGRLGDEPVIVTGTLRDDARPTPYGASIEVEVRAVGGLPGGAAGAPARSIPTRGGARLSIVGSLVPIRIAEWRAGRDIRVAAVLRPPTTYLNDGARDEERALARRGIALVGSVKSAALVDLVSRATPAGEVAATIRAFVRHTIARDVGRRSARSAAIVTAILIGDRAGLDDDLERRLQEAGTYHVIAISGGNLAILAGLLVWGARLSGLTRMGAAVVIVALAAYAGVVGGGASVARATLVAVICFGARLADLRAGAMNAVATAAVLIVAVTPLALYDAGLALTFGATVAILAGAASAFHRDAVWPDGRWWRLPATLLAATVCAELATFPVSAAAFSRVGLAGLVLNFAAIPLMTVAQVAGLLTVGCAAVLSPIAAAPAAIAHLAAEGLVGSTRLLDVAPWLSWRVPPPATIVVCLYYAAVLLSLGPALISWRPALAGPVVRLWRPALAGPVIRLWRPALAGPSIAIASAVVIAAPPILRDVPDRVWRHVRAASGAPAVTFTVLDVGQGDALLVQWKSGESMLVDTGGVPGAFDIGERVVAPALWAKGVRRLDVLVLTHGDPDHVGGAAAIIRDFRPRQIWEGIEIPTHEGLRGLRADALSRGLDWRAVRAGDTRRLGGTDLRVWHPSSPDWERQKVRNDDSIVLELQVRDVSLLLTGDIGREIERVIAPILPAVSARLMKAPHHGSGTSSSAGFLARTGPSVVIVSAGRRNRYGHPTPAVLQRYYAAGAHVFRTDQDGAVTVVTDGRTVEVRTFTGRTFAFSSPSLAARRGR